MEVSKHFYEDPVKRREDDHRMALEGVAVEDAGDWEEHDQGLTQDEVWVVFSLGNMATGS